MQQVRIAPVDHSALDARQKHVAEKMGRFGSPDASNLMRTMLNYPEFARSIGRMSTRVTLTSDLPPRLWQLACMRTAWLCGSAYLWASHKAECFALGIAGDELRAVAEDTAALAGDDRLIVDAVDRLHTLHYLPDDTWSALARFGQHAAMDLTITYGFYVTLAAFANSAGVALDDGLEDVPEPFGGTTTSGEARHSLRTYPKRVEEADYDRLTPQQREQTGRMGRRGLPTTSKLQKAMINYVEFMKALSPFGKRAIDNTSLPPRLWQLACMRTVWLCDSEYLWSQHRKAILKLGVSDDVLHGVAEGTDSARLEGLDAAVVRAVDELYYGNRLSDESWGAFGQFGDGEGVTDLILVYGLYVIQSCVARNFGTTLEPETTGYLPELEPLRDAQQR